MIVDGFYIIIKCVVYFRVKFLKELLNKEELYIVFYKQVNGLYLLIFFEMVGCCLLYIFKDGILIKIEEIIVF